MARFVPNVLHVALALRAVKILATPSGRRET